MRTTLCVRRRQSVAVLVAIALMASACSDDDETVPRGATETTAPGGSGRCGRGAGRGGGVGCDRLWQEARGGPSDLAIALFCMYSFRSCWAATSASCESVTPDSAASTRAWASSNRILRRGRSPSRPRHHHHHSSLPRRRHQGDPDQYGHELALTHNVVRMRLLESLLQIVTKWMVARLSMVARTKGGCAWPRTVPNGICHRERDRPGRSPSGREDVRGRAHRRGGGRVRYVVAARTTAQASFISDITRRPGSGLEGAEPHLRDAAPYRRCGEPARCELAASLHAAKHPRLMPLSPP